jgi:hypothetical protein
LLHGVPAGPAQVRELEAALDQGTAHSEELQSALDSVQAALDDARSQSAKQASRLAHLESEFEALQEVMGEGEQRDIVGRLLGRISTLQAAAAAAEATRRQLHNQMVELRGNVSGWQCLVRVLGAAGGDGAKCGGVSRSTCSLLEQTTWTGVLVFCFSLILNTLWLAACVYCRSVCSVACGRTLQALCAAWLAARHWR